MSNFNDTLNRMKELYTYGKELNESKEMNTHSIEYHAIAADGKSYGIIRENSKYYIKSAPKAKELIPEAYEYLGGFCNKSNYEYTSYNNALKNFELKMASINEACEGNVNISTLDPFKKGEFLVEATDKMKNEIARQRQIMYNAAMLMNEATEIGASRKDYVVKYDGKQPEAEDGKRGDEDLKDTKANPEFKGTNTNGVDKKVAPFEENPKQVNEACDAAGCDSDSEDWGSVGLNKGEDPKKIGWEMENQKTVNEGEDCCPKCGKCGAECTCEGLKENEDWASQGLPSTPGVGEADTDHNNDPFKETVNEDEDIEFDEEPEVEEPVEDFEEPELGEEEPVEEPEEEDELTLTFDEEEPEESDNEETFDEEPENEPEKEEEPVEEPENEEEPEEVETDEEPAEEPEEVKDEEIPVEEPEEEVGVEEEPEDLFEDKKNIMNKIVESVTAKILKENELNVFGKHPGYRKKPMELPTTGEDKTQWGKDWNDESVYSEEPFGSKIGDGNPFNQLVDSVTKKVVEKLLEGKKKVK